MNAELQPGEMQRIVDDVERDAIKKDIPRPSLEEVHAAFDRIGAISRDVVEVIMAVAVSILREDLYEKPLWIILVGNPSSAKTELVQSLKGLEHIYYLDTMTANPFASGYMPKKGEPHDLLSELNGKCLAIRDMTTMFSLNDETVRKLLGEMVSIYDGEFDKFTPTRGLLQFDATFSLLGCITPAALNKHRRYLDMIGPRFLFVRMPDLTKEREDKGFVVAWQKESRRDLIKQARVMLRSYINGIITDQAGIEPESEEVRETLNGLAKFVARGRGVVITTPQKFKDDEGQERTFYEIEGVQIEEPWRALLQLRGLARCLTLVRGRTTIETKELKTLTDIAVASMPPDRASVVEKLLENPTLTTKELSELLPERSQRQYQRLCKELAALGLADSFKEKNKDAEDNAPQKWFLDEDIKRVLLKVKSGVATGETVSNPVLPEF